ncbi:tetratricopeptide repeat protein [Alkalihalobacillus sp. NPDC078783]
MENTLVVHTFGTKCVEWYSCIITRDIQQSVKMKIEIDNLLDDIAHDESLLTYYGLVNYRHSLLMEDVQKRLEVSEQDIEQSQSDIFLNYMFYFLKGQEKFHKGKYKSAIKLYNSASKHIEKVESNIEQAEFYYKVGIAYYRLNQYAVAMSYIEQAKDIFSISKDTLEKTLNCDSVTACIYSETEDFKKADKLFTSAIEKALEFPNTYALLLRAHANNLLRQDRLNEAEKYMEDAISVTEHKSSYVGLKSMSELANIKLRLNKTDEGIRLLEEAEKEALSVQNYEYIERNRITRCLYVFYNESILEESIQSLINKGFYFEVFEVATEISKYFEEKDDLNKTSNYLKLALQMHIKQIELGE